jgi:hypothetical protein
MATGVATEVGGSEVDRGGADFLNTMIDCIERDEIVSVIVKKDRVKDHTFANTM